MRFTVCSHMRETLLVQGASGQVPDSVEPHRKSSHPPVARERLTAAGCKRSWFLIETLILELDTV